MIHAGEKMKQIDQIIVDSNEKINETRTKNLSKADNNSLNDSQEEIIEETIIYEVLSPSSQNSCGEDKSSSEGVQGCHQVHQGSHFSARVKHIK